MREFHTKRSHSLLGRRGALALALACVVLGTTGFAAAGGIEIVKGWFITIEVNGEPVDIGDADIDVRTDGDAVTITVDGLDVDVEDGAVITITAGTCEDGNTVKVSGSDREGKTAKDRGDGEDSDQDE